MQNLFDDPQMTLWAAGGLALLCVAAIAYALFGDDSGARARKRVQKLDPKAKGKSWSPFGDAEHSARDRLKMLEDEQKKSSSQKTSMRIKLEQAGVRSTPAQFLLQFYLAAAAVGAGVFVYYGSPLVALGVAVVVAFLLPTIVVKKKIEGRVNKFLEIFPNALDILVRGVRSGLPVSESMKVAANELPDPVGAELREVVATTNMGVPMEEALAKMAMRIPSPDVNFFRTVLAIQRQTGGNLAESLSNLSNVLRERRKMKKKIVALSSEARMSAIIIGALPILVGVLVYFMKPDYIMLLFTDSFGQIMVAGGAFWMLCGIMIMRWMVRFEI
ncbi:MAG: type II secretion system F family protein [Pseudomonadota bacterium]